MTREKEYCNLLSVIMVVITALVLQSCFTGVEGTRKITLSKKEVNITAPSEEDLFLADIKPPTIKNWKPGKQLLVTDDKLRFITESDGNTVSEGDTIVFQEIKGKHGADGIDKAVLFFNNNGSIIQYALDKTMEEALDDLTAADLAMLIDLETVSAVNDRLSGKRVWTKTTLWYGDSMKHIKGRKFVPVTITAVESGNTFFPLNIRFTDEGGKMGGLLMSIGSTGNDSRSFSRLFSLKDPRLNYRQISDTNWNAIQNEEVVIGMTKEECRLSKGNPSDVNTGHDYSNTMEIWYYPNGSYLRFVDGLLVGFK